MKDEAKRLFDQLVDIESAARRKEILDRACANKPELRAQVEALLAAHDQTDNDFEPSLSKVERTVTHAQPQAEATGSSIGPYKLLQQIGEGGMGTVYMAEQTSPVSRRVALKVIKTGMDSGEVLARFDAERQALAMMDHPNIARVLDAGTTESGRPYFVMELVHGIPFTEYCDEHRLGTRERLELFIPVCQAIAHAHQKGIIHRDIKPSNVMVAEYDSQPVPKVIDFGIAKATSQKLTQQTLFTQYGQLIGTVDYMSPEQAKFNQLDIDTRSDVYSLGVLLYEVLAGSTPFDRQRLRSAAFDEMLRIIREEEPPRPSTRLTTSKTASKVAANRKTEPQSLSRLLRGDLDWIVMKALAKERHDRYASAPEFAADIRRYLDDQPIEARRPSAIGRARRIVRRHKVPVVLATLCVAAGLAAIILGFVALSNRARTLASEARESELELAVLTTEQERKVAEQETRLLALQEQRKREINTVLSHYRMSQAMQPEQSVLLAVEAAEYSQRHDNVMAPVVHEALLNSVASLSGQTLPENQPSFENPAMTSRWLVGLAAWGEKPVIKLWDCTKDRPLEHPPIILDQRQTHAYTTDYERTHLVTIGDGLRVWSLEGNSPSLVKTLLAENLEDSLLHLSPNGQWLVVRKQDGRVLVWNLASQESNPRIVGQLTGDGHSLFISNDGRWVAMWVGNAVLGNTHQLWDLQLDNPGASPLFLDKHLSSTGWMTLLAISPNGRWLVGRGGRIFDLSAEDPVEAPLQLNSQATTAAFSPDSKKLYTGAAHHAGLRCWDMTKVVEDPGYQPLVFPGQKDGVFSITVSRDGRRLVSSGFHDLFVWELKDVDPPATLRVMRHSNVAAVVAADPTGRWVAVGGQASRLWDLSTTDPDLSSLVLRQSGNVTNNADSQLAVSHSGRWVAAGNYDGGVELWDNLSRNVPSSFQRTLPGLAHRLAALRISPNDNWLVATSRANHSRVWHLKDGDPTLTSRDFGEPVPAKHVADNKIMNFSSLGDRWLFTKGLHQDVLQWDLNGTNAESTSPKYRYPSSPVFGLMASRDGTRMASVSREGYRYWNLEDSRSPQQHVLLEKEDDWGELVQLSGDGRRLAVTHDNSVYVWDFRNNSPKMKVLPPPESRSSNGFWQMRMSLDSKWIFATRFNGQAHLYNVGRSPPTMQTLSGQVQWAAISPDSRWLATSHRHSNVQLWDLKHEDPKSTLRILSGHEGPVWRVAFSGDSKWLVTSSSDGTIRRWMLDVGELISYAKRIAGRKLTDTEIERFGIVD